MKENLLVTLADASFVEQAKQLFSSVYWNAGWDGDYMLLAHEIHEDDLTWFTDKGILIRKCEVLDLKTSKKNFKTVYLAKLHLFTPEFKKWKHIIFLDADMIVTGSLDRLKNIKGFGAATSTIKLSRQFTPEAAAIKEIKKRYHLRRRSFNTGIIAFSTDVISHNMMEEITLLFKKYGMIMPYFEEGILNLYFYRRWIKIPRVYNLFINFLLYYDGLKHRKRKAIVMHFIRVINYDKYRPWDKDNPFYDEWKTNLDRAELMDPGHISKVKPWKSVKICYYSMIYDLYLLYGLQKIITFIRNLPDKLLGMAGALIKRISPKFYNKLKH
jgi:lipopolysaccharide biosynthesis glycosyltransferase